MATTDATGGPSPPERKPGPTPGKRRYAGKSAEARRAARRERILEAGTKLLGSRGFANTSIDAVCAEADLTKRYFYESFGSREDLLRAAYRSAFQGMAASSMRAVLASQGDPRGMIEACLTAVFTYLREHPHEARVMMIESLGAGLDESKNESIGGLVRLTLGLSRPYYGPKAPPPAGQKTIIVALVGGVVFVCQRWIRTGYAQPMEELVGSTLDLLTTAARELFDVEM